VAVVMEATNLWMSMRGVQKKNNFAVTSAMLGTFRSDPRTRSEFLELIKLRAGAVASRELTTSAGLGLECVND
jgi:hypothetical protein